MNIKKPEELQVAIELVLSGDREIIYDIARYIAYNYYMYTHIKKDSLEDIENERIYKEFEKNYPDLFKEVEEYVNMIYDKD